MNSEAAQALLPKLRELAAGAEAFYTSIGATKPTDRLFVEAGMSMPDKLNTLLLNIIHTLNDGQRIFLQGAVFGFMTDDARILCKAAHLSAAGYWAVVAAAAAEATELKLTSTDILRGLTACGIAPESVNPGVVKEIYWV